MTTYQYNVYTKETFNATGKAKGDIITILDNMGIQNLYHPSSHRMIRIAQQWLAINRLQKDKNPTLIIQYPAVVDAFIKRVSKGSRLIAIIHDLQSIRGTKSIKDEIEILNTFDVLISHNKAMTRYLKDNGCNSDIIELTAFDYLNDDVKTVPTNYQRKVVSFAGNLNKSTFVKRLAKVSDVDFKLYGMIDNVATLHGVEYAGVLPSDEIVNELDGEFGLIWDGESVETCSGTLGNYLRFNNPHKMSLYLAAGKPVITWKSSAVAPFISENGLGIVVESLLDLSVILNRLSETQYNEMKMNVDKIRQKLIHGEYTKAAVKRALKMEEDN